MPRLTLSTWRPEAFRDARQARGWTIEQVAMHTEINPATVRSYATGVANPSPGALVAIAAALQVPTTELAPMQDPPRLHELRWHAGYTVEQLAAKAGYGANYAAGILRGSTPITNPEVWARALDVDEATLHRAWEATRSDAKSRP